MDSSARVAPQGWDKFGTPEKSAKGIARVVPQAYMDGSSYTFDSVKQSAPKATQVVEDRPTRFWIAFDGKTE